MGSPDFTRIETLFKEALSRPESDRRAFLRESTGEDTALFDEVWAMLEHDVAPHGMFGVDAVEVVSCVIADSAPDETIGPVRIGRYRIIRMLDRGGMGVVYLAEQEEPRRQVALKVLQSGLVTPGRVRRFAQEVQLLARLRHPGIAQVYDADSHDFGDGRRPWFAMEYIDGLPITEYASTNGLDIEDRLRLMISVCNAVQHAHHRGVIHRDLKPGNILVCNEDGVESDDTALTFKGRSTARTKVLDFGIARATDRELGQSTMHTQEGQLLGTLPYMSPEQVAGDTTDVDVRSDVYALGVILYELLAGRLPYEVADRPLPTVARTIIETEPTPLSVTDRALGGDLEQIVRKALAKDRRERYQSASALAEDLLRYLADEPVHARPPSAWYQWRKFAKRNRTLVMSAAIIFVVLLASSVVTSILYFRAERESDAKAVQIIETEWQAYIANIAAAHSAIRAGRTFDARRFLDLAPVHLRAWEWRHLDAKLSRASVTLRGSERFVEDAIFSRDGSRVITGDDVGHLRVFDADSGAALAVNKDAHRHWIHDLDLHPTLDQLAVASSDRTIGIFEPTTLEEIRRLGPLPAAVRAVEWGPNGSTLFAALDDGTVLRLQAEDGQVQTTFDGHSLGVKTLALTSSGKTLITGSDDKTVRFWNTRTGEQFAKLITDSPLRRVCVSLDDRWLAYSEVSGHVSVFNLLEQEALTSWPADVNAVNCLRFNNDATKLVTGSQLSRLRLWDCSSWRMVGEWLGHTGPIRSVAYSPDGDRLVTGSEDNTACIWKMNEIGVDAIRSHNAWVYDVAINDDGTRLAASSGTFPDPDGSVRLFDLREGIELHRLAPKDDLQSIVFHVASNNDLSSIVTHSNSTIRIWRPESDVLTEYEGGVTSSSSTVSPDGRYAAIASWSEPRVHVIDLYQDEQAAVLDATGLLASQGGFFEVLFSPKGDRILALVDGGRDIVSWSWPEGEFEGVQKLPGGSRAFSITISRDGLLMAAAHRNRIDIIEFVSWKTLATLPVHGAFPTSIRISPDRSRLFAGSADGAIRIWDLPSRRLVSILYVHSAEILDLEISTDGTTLVSGGGDSTIHVLRAPPARSGTVTD